MKKLTLFFAIILLSLASCYGSNGNKVAHNTGCDSLSTVDAEEQIRRASIIAGSFVELSMDMDCKFDTFYCKGYATGMDGRYVIIQKFTSNYKGKEEKFGYIAYVQFFGGDWKNIANWSYGMLMVARGEKEYSFTGNMEQRAKELGCTFNEQEIEGVAYTVYLDDGRIMQIASEKELPQNIITKITEKYSHLSRILLFTTYDMLGYRDGYLHALDGTAVYKNGKVYDVKTWEQL